MATPSALAWKSCFAVVLLAADSGRAAAGGEASKANGKARLGFSFAAYGDSRSMMVLPDKADQEAEARQLMVDMFALVLPEKAAREMAEKEEPVVCPKH